MSQDIVLVSNASMDLYPDNKLHDFRVRLPQPIVLDPSYRVALTRISYTKSFFNYEAGFAKIILAESREEYVPEPEFAKDCRLMVVLTAGYYDNETFLDMVQLEMGRQLKIKGSKDTAIKDTPTYTLSNGYLVTQAGTIETGGILPTPWILKFDKDTERMLGINNLSKPRPMFLNQGLTDLYIYSDVVQRSIVGDKTVELLNILDGHTEEDFGAHCCETWDDPWWHRLASTTIQDIRIFIRKDDGNSPYFRFGRVSLRLSFKKEDAIR